MALVHVGGTRTRTLFLNQIILRTQPALTFLFDHAAQLSVKIWSIAHSITRCALHLEPLIDFLDRVYRIAVIVALA